MADARRAERRDQGARPRAQEGADRQPVGLAGRRRQRRVRARHRADAGAERGPAQRTTRSTSCRAIPTCRSSNIPPSCRPAPRSIRRSAISTTRCCARRSTASRRRSTTSSSAATSPPARRCSPSSTTARPGSTPIRRKPTSPICRSASAALVIVDTFPDHTVLRHRGRGQPRHRRAIRDPAAAERQRQLGQGGAARAGAHPARSAIRWRASCAPA